MSIVNGASYSEVNSFIEMLESHYRKRFCSWATRRYAIVVSPDEIDQAWNDALMHVWRDRVICDSEKEIAMVMIRYIKGAVRELKKKYFNGKANVWRPGGELLYAVAEGRSLAGQDACHDEDDLLLDRQIAVIQRLENELHGKQKIVFHALRRVVGSLNFGKSREAKRRNLVGLPAELDKAVPGGFRVLKNSIRLKAVAMLEGKSVWQYQNDRWGKKR